MKTWYEGQTAKQPKDKGLQKAFRKLRRLASRGARPRVLRRLAARVDRLMADYQRRMKAWKAAHYNGPDPFGTGQGP